MTLKRLNRIIALVLIACLLTEPLRAYSFTDRRTTSTHGMFQNQAVVESLVSFRRRNFIDRAQVKVTFGALLFGVGSYLAAHGHPQGFWLSLSGGATVAMSHASEEPEPEMNPVILKSLREGTVVMFKKQPYRVISLPEVNYGNQKVLGAELKSVGRLGNVIVYGESLEDIKDTDRDYSNTPKTSTAHRGRSQRGIVSAELALLIGGLAPLIHAIISPTGQLIAIAGLIGMMHLPRGRYQQIQEEEREAKAPKISADLERQYRFLKGLNRFFHALKSHEKEEPLILLIQYGTLRLRLREPSDGALRTEFEALWKYLIEETDLMPLRVEGDDGRQQIEFVIPNDDLGRAIKLVANKFVLNQAPKESDPEPMRSILIAVGVGLFYAASTMDAEALHPRRILPVNPWVEILASPLVVGLILLLIGVMPRIRLWLLLHPKKHSSRPDDISSIHYESDRLEVTETQRRLAELETMIEHPFKRTVRELLGLPMNDLSPHPPQSPVVTVPVEPPARVRSAAAGHSGSSEKGMTKIAFAGIALLFFGIGVWFNNIPSSLGLITAGVLALWVGRTPAHASFPHSSKSAA